MSLKFNGGLTKGNEPILNYKTKQKIHNKTKPMNKHTPPLFENTENVFPQLSYHFFLNNSHPWDLFCPQDFPSLPVATCS